jgi:hypothetical protein
VAVSTIGDPPPEPQYGLHIAVAPPQVKNEKIER